MKIDDTLLNKLEKLSHLEIESEKRVGIERELSEILNFIENLSELDTDKYPSKFMMLDDVKSHLREDVKNLDETVGTSIVANSPKSEDNFFVVSKIIE